MRRAIAVAALMIMLPLAAACSAERRDAGADAARGTGTGSSAGATPGASGQAAPSNGAGASPGASPGAAPIPTAKAGGNGPQVCAAARTESEKGTTAYIDQLSVLLQAQGMGDKAAVDAARAKLDSGLDSWAGELRRLSGTAQDAQLKAVLGELAAEVDRMEANLDSVDDGRLGNIQDRLDALCPA
jgi:hypothetical protein